MAAVTIQRSDQVRSGSPAEGARAGADISTAGLHELLAGYRDGFELLEGCPSVHWLCMGPGRVGRLVRLPRVRGIVRMQFGFQVNRVLEALKRRCSLLIATGDPRVSETDVAAIEHMQASIKTPSYRRYVIALLLVAFLVAYVLSNFVIDPRSLDMGSGVHANSLIGNFTTSVVELNRSGIVNAFKRQTAGDVVYALLIVLGSLWLVLLVPSMAFRLKRAIFNHTRGLPDSLHETNAAKHATLSTGIYTLEQNAFIGLGQRRAVREIPLDVIEPTLLITSLVVWAMFQGLSHLPHGVDVGLTFGIVVWSLGYCVAASEAVRTRLRDRSEVGPPPPAGASEGPPVSPGHWRGRSIAYLLDFALIAAPAVGFALVVSPNVHWFSSLSTHFRWWMWVGCSFVIMGAIYGALIALPSGLAHGQSLGKRAVKLRVVKTDPDAREGAGSGGAVRPKWIFIRDGLMKWGLFVFPFALLDVGWALFDEQNRCLHDVLCETQVTRARSVPTSGTQDPA